MLGAFSGMGRRRVVPVPFRILWFHSSRGGGILEQGIPVFIRGNGGGKSP